MSDGIELSEIDSAQGLGDSPMVSDDFAATFNSAAFGDDDEDDEDDGGGVGGLAGGDEDEDEDDDLQLGEGTATDHFVASLREGTKRALEGWLGVAFVHDDTRSRSRSRGRSTTAASGTSDVESGGGGGGGGSGRGVEAVRSLALHWKTKTLGLSGGRSDGSHSPRSRGRSTSGMGGDEHLEYQQRWRAVPSFWIPRAQATELEEDVEYNSNYDADMLRIFAETDIAPAGKTHGTTLAGRSADTHARQRQVDLRRVSTGGAHGSRQTLRRQPSMRRKPAVPPELLMPERYPVFIYTVTLIEILLFVFSVMENGGFEPLEVNPWLGPSTQVLLDLGAKYGPYMREPRNETYRFVTAVFLHVGVGHLLMNLMFQVGIGRHLETQYGWFRVGAVYIIAGIGGNLASVLFVPDLIQVGASGALYGLLGTIVVDLFQNWNLIRQLGENPYWILCKQFFVILISLGTGVLPAVDNFAHAGGCLFGILAAIVFFPSINFGKWSAIWKLAMSLSSALIIVILMVTGFELFQDQKEADDWCSWCSEINCLSAVFDCGVEE